MAARPRRIDQRAPLAPSVGVKAAHAAVRESIPPLTEDRPLYRDIDAIRRLLQSGAIERAVAFLRTKQLRSGAWIAGECFEPQSSATHLVVLAFLDRVPPVEARGYAIVLSVHDELLTETPDVGGDNGYSAKELSAIMATVPAWAAGLPLAAGGFEATRYRKDA